MFVRYRVRSEERGFLFRDREFQRVLRPGVTWVFDPLLRTRVDLVSVRDPWIRNASLDVIVKSGALADEAVVLDLRDTERALVFLDGRFEAVLKPGLHALWKVFRQVRVETVDAREVRFTHERLATILASPTAKETLESFTVETGQRGLFFKDGELVSSLGAGTYAFWKGMGKYRLVIVGMREQVIDITGQEIMTSDKVTLRLNAVVGYRVTDPLAAVTTVEDFKQALYREAQLALRGVIGTRELDELLMSKDGVVNTLTALVSERAAAFGLTVTTLGIRDLVLPGEMKDLLNKVTEAKKAAEASLVTRREETAAMRSQANTARIFEGNPMLMRLRELEVLERVAGKAKLQVVLGDRSLTDTIVKVI